LVVGVGLLAWLSCTGSGGWLWLGCSLFCCCVVGG